MRIRTVAISALIGGTIYTGLSFAAGLAWTPETGANNVLIAVNQAFCAADRDAPGIVCPFRVSKAPETAPAPMPRPAAPVEAPAPQPRPLTIAHEIGGPSLYAWDTAAQCAAHVATVAAESGRSLACATEESN